MKKISTIGLDLAKRVFQVHGIDDQGNVVVQKQLSRSDVLVWFSKIEPCLVGVESCATSTYWAREISKFGHSVKLMPPAYVKPKRVASIALANKMARVAWAVLTKGGVYRCAAAT